MVMFRESRLRSLMPFWSGAKTSLGGLSGSIVEVTHEPLLHPGGRAGAVTPSKFSTQPMGGSDGVGVAAGGDGIGEGV